jgi:hypothetical protein
MANFIARVKTLYKQAMKARESKEPIEIKGGKKVLPDEISKLKHFESKIVEEAFALKQAQLSDYAEKENLFMELLATAMQHRNEITGGRLTLDDPFCWETLDGKTRVISSAQETPKIEDGLVEAKKLFEEFTAKHFADDSNVSKAFIKLAERAFRSLDLSIQPVPADIRAFSDALDEFDKAKYPEIEAIQLNLSKGYGYHQNKRKIMVKTRDTFANEEMTLSIKNYLNLKTQEA